MSVTVEWPISNYLKQLVSKTLAGVKQNCIDLYCLQKSNFEARICNIFLLSNAETLTKISTKFYCFLYSINLTEYVVMEPRVCVCMFVCMYVCIRAVNRFKFPNRFLTVFLHVNRCKKPVIWTVYMARIGCTWEMKKKRLIGLSFNVCRS